VKTRLRNFLGRREDSLAVQSIILTAARIASFAITFGIPIVLVRVFDQTAFGVYKQLVLLLATAIPILNLGMYASLFYFVPRDEGEGQRYIIQAIGLLTLTGALGGLAVLIGADQIGSGLGEGAIRPYLPLLALVILISTPAELVHSVPVVDRRPTLAALAMAGNDLLRAAAIIATAIMSRSLTAVLWAIVAAATVRGLWLLVYVSLRRTDKGLPPSLADLKQQLTYSLPFAAAVLFQIGHVQFHQYYVAAEVSSAEFAIYAVGILQVPIVGMLTQSVVEVMLVRMTAAYEKKEFDEMRRVWHSALARLGVLLIPCWVLAQVFAANIIVLLFGEPYVGAVPVFRVFVSTVLLMMIVDHSVLRSTGDTTFVFWCCWLGHGACPVRWEGT
jgi:O-antigen/teichoic acid export membrane protein